MATLFLFLKSKKRISQIIPLSIMLSLLLPHNRLQMLRKKVNTKNPWSQKDKLAIKMSCIIRMYKLYYFHTKHNWKRSELQSYGLMLSSFRIPVTLSDAWKTKAPKPLLDTQQWDTLVPVVWWAQTHLNIKRQSKVTGIRLSIPYN